MSEADGVWRLVRGDEVLAELVVTAEIFLAQRQGPVRGGFEDVRPLFEYELRLLDLLGDEPDLWETAHSRVREVVRLLARTGGQCRNSCFTSRAERPGGGEATSPS